MWNTVLLVVVFSVFWRMTDGNSYIEMCENKTLTMNSFFLIRSGLQSSTNCWCQIISERGNSTKVTFNVFSFIGQQYKLSVSNGIYTQYFENRMSQDMFYDISGSEEIKLKLEENNCSVKDGLEFVININSTSGNINITCHNPTVSTPELCTQITSEVTTTSTSTITNTSPVTTSTLITTKPSDTVPTDTYTNISSIEKASEATTNSQNDKTTNSTAMSDLVAGLIGGLISCIIVVIVLIIVIVCIVRRHQQKEELYSQPSTVRPPQDEGYTDLNFTPSRQQPVG